ncbi:ribosome maturation factor RimM [Corynebacterium kroppenstedtii]|uniref:ribosome maturation factor RimM n=1 Tax=Corynebacterium sp. PCR 32 TaxID=3351342 RepID=UPI0030A393E2
MTKHDDSPHSPDYVQIGRVIKPHGVRGEFIVEPTTDDPRGRFAVGAVVRAVPSGGRQRRKSKEDQDLFSLTIAAVRGHQGRMILRADGISDRDAAESLRGVRFLAEPELDDSGEEFYDFELEGLHVLTVGQVTADEAYARAYDGAQPEPEDIGIVTNVLRGPAHRLLEVTMDTGSSVSNPGTDSAAAHGSRTVLIPFVESIVPIVDTDNEAIVITPPDGLLDLR